MIHPDSIESPSISPPRVRSAAELRAIVVDRGGVDVHWAGTRAEALHCDSETHHAPSEVTRQRASQGVSRGRNQEHGAHRTCHESRHHEQHGTEQA
jgi:hypothetical protein